MSFIDHFDMNVRARGDRPAIHYGGETITYAELDADANRFANVLEDAGVGEGEKISLYFGNEPDYVVAWLGALKRGAVPFAINTRFEGGEVTTVLEDGDAVAHVHSELDRSLLEYVRAVDSLDTIFTTGAETPEGTIDFAAELDAASPTYETTSRSLSDTAELMFTSGTTGRPKGVRHTHQNLVASSMGTISRYGIDATDTGIIGTPIFHIAGGMILYASLMAGCDMILVDGWDPENYLASVERHRGSFAHLITTMVVDLVNLDDDALESYDTDSFRVTISGGGITTDRTIERYQEYVCDWLAEGYGLTEAVGGVFHPPNEPRRKARQGEYKRGIPLDRRWFEAKIVDLDTREELPRGEVGEILLRGDAVSPGYYNRPDANAASYADGWLITDDSGYVDEDDYVYYVGRADDMIKTGGENVFPAEVEGVLSDWDEVNEVVVFGIPDERLGEKIAAVVEPAVGSASLTEADVVEFCRSSDAMANFKRPRSIVIVDEIPKLETQKADVQAARDLVLEREGLDD